MNVANKAIVAPQLLPEMLGQVVKALAEAKGTAAPAAVAGLQVADEARRIAASLASGKAVGVFLGNLAEQHPRAAELQVLVQMLAELSGGRFGFLGQAGNSVGGYIAGCLPQGKGLNAADMLRAPRKAYVLVGVEPELDCNDPVQTLSALRSAEFVVALSSYRGQLAEHVDVMLPLAPFTETSGTFINCEGRSQSFNGVVRPLGDTRPGWKVLRVLGNLLGVEGFEYDQSEAVRDAACGTASVASKLGNGIEGVSVGLKPVADSGLQRLADVPVYFSDPVVRRAESLQQSRDAKVPAARLSPVLAQRLGVAAGDRVKVRQGGEAVLEVMLEAGLPDGVVRIAAGHPATAGLGAMSGTISVEKA